MMEFILSHVEKGVMTLTLNRPERLNSFNDEMHAQLAECLKQVERDDTIRCLLLTGAGRGFCAGQDLNATSLLLPVQQNSSWRLVS